MTSVERVFALFELFSEAGRAMNLSEIARSLGIPASTSFNIIRTLQASGYLYEVEVRTYYPTGRLFQIGKQISRQNPFRQRIAPQLRALSDECGETALLSKIVRGRLMLLEVELCKSLIRYVPQVGDFRPLHGSASGKALLSLQPDDRLQETLGGMKLTPLTEKTITDPVALLRNICAGRERGWFSAQGEGLIDSMSIARPISIGNSNFSVSIVGPVYRMARKKTQLAVQLVTCCERILREIRPRADARRRA